MAQELESPSEESSRTVFLIPPGETTAKAVRATPGRREEYLKAGWREASQGEAQRSYAKHRTGTFDAALVGAGKMGMPALIKTGVAGKIAETIDPSLEGVTKGELSQAVGDIEEARPGPAFYGQAASLFGPQAVGGLAAKMGLLGLGAKTAATAVAERGAVKSTAMLMGEAAVYDTGMSLGDKVLENPEMGAEAMASALGSSMLDSIGPTAIVGGMGVTGHLAKATGKGIRAAAKPEGALGRATDWAYKNLTKGDPKLKGSLWDKVRNQRLVHGKEIIAKAEDAVDEQVGNMMDGFSQEAMKITRSSRRQNYSKMIDDDLHLDGAIKSGREVGAAVTKEIDDFLTGSGQPVAGRKLTPGLAKIQKQARAIESLAEDLAQGNIPGKARALKMHSTIDNLKVDMQGYAFASSKKGWNTAEKDARKLVRGLSETPRVNLESAERWGKAGDVQKGTLGTFSPIMEDMDAFAKRHGIDPRRMTTKDQRRKLAKRIMTDDEAAADFARIAGKQAEYTRAIGGGQRSYGPNVAIDEYKKVKKVLAEQAELQKQLGAQVFPWYSSMIAGGLMGVPGLGAVAGGVARLRSVPDKILMRTAWIQDKAMRNQASIRSSIKKWGKRARSGQVFAQRSVKSIAAMDQARDQHDARVKKAKEMAANPEYMASQLQEHGAALANAAPNLAGLAMAKAQQSIVNMAASVPDSPMDYLAMKPREELTDMEKAKIQRYTAASLDPTLLGDELLSGTLTMETANAVRENHPLHYADAQALIMEEVQQGDIPYDYRNQISIIMDVPTTRAQEYTAQIQLVHAAPQTMDRDAASQPKPANLPEKSVKGTEFQRAASLPPGEDA